MKLALLFIIILLTSINALIAQNSSLAISRSGEFEVHQNGLIYDTFTMSKLKFIVDSLNVKFRMCDLTKKYYSKPQTKAHYIKIEGRIAKKVKKDLDKNLSVDELQKKYPKLMADKDVLVSKFQYKNHQEEDVVDFSVIPLDEYDGYGFTFINDPVKYSMPVEDKWLYRADKQYLEGFYFLEEFQTKVLDDKYASMVQYSDCMIDTTSEIFFENAIERPFFNIKTSKNLSEFMDLVETYPDKPKAPEYPNGVSVFDFEDKDKDTAEIRRKLEKYYQEQELYDKKYEKWSNRRIVWIDNELSKTEPFKKLLKAGLEDVERDTIFHDGFEFYLARYLSKEKALQLKRSRVVWGSCSMDDSPRRQARDIAMLAAETVKWEIFLRAHLNIMNDLFNRMSDGSYAWERRNTYIKELEELNINVLDLLLGISLRIENPSQNHYFGDIGRLGRALAETKYSEEFKRKIVDMIKDPQLDYYNRVIMCYLFLNYNYHLSDEKEKSENIAMIKTAIATLPDYIARRISVE